MKRIFKIIWFDFPAPCHVLPNHTHNKKEKKIMTIDEIREDLKEIRYYYSMQDMFQRGKKVVQPIALLQKVERYHKAISDAPGKLYVLYMALYVQNNSQAALAEDWGFTPDYIKQMNKQLCEYFQEYFQSNP